MPPAAPDAQPGCKIAESPAIAQGKFYEANLAALNSFQPDVADEVRAVAIPASIAAAKGRDGSETFVIRGADGRSTWFGRSSAPTISAPALCRNRQSDDTGMMLPGILTGLEVHLLAERMSNFSAVFVVERDPLAIKLALHLYDYTNLLRNGRLVFILGDNLAERLRTFFEAHPGYELPQRLLNVPHLTAVEMTEMQREIEIAGEAVVEVQARAIDALAGALRRRRYESLPDRPAVAILSVDSRAHSLADVQRIEESLGELGWEHRTCVPDMPGNCHPAARMRAIVEAGADCVLFVNCGPGRLTTLLPSALPLASWLTTEVDLASIHAARNLANYTVFAGTSTLVERLSEAGIPTDRIVRCEPAADPVMCRAAQTAPPNRFGASAGIAVLMDLPDDRPEAVNLTLGSQITLWRAMQQVASRTVDRFQNGLAEELFDAAQKECGVTVSDAVVRAPFLQLLCTRIGPAAIGRATAETLANSGAAVALWGENWPDSLNASTTRRGPIPSGEALGRLLACAGIVVIPELSVGAVQRAVDALAAGAMVICRGTCEQFIGEHPELTELAAHLTFYESRTELADAVRQIHADPEAARSRTKSAQATVEDHHTTAHRLTAIRDHFRARQTST